MPIDITIGGGGRPWWLDLIIQLIPSIAVAVVVAWLTVKLAFRKHMQEKWWDRKAEVYDGVIVSIRKQILAFGALSLHRHGIPLPEHTVMEKLSCVRDTIGQLDMYQGYVGYFLSEEAGDIIEKVKNNLLQSMGDDSVLLGSNLEFIQKCHLDMIKIARKDLKIPKSLVEVTKETKQ